MSIERLKTWPKSVRPEDVAAAEAEQQRVALEPDPDAVTPPAVEASEATKGKKAKKK